MFNGQSIRSEFPLYEAEQPAYETRSITHPPVAAIDVSSPVEESPSLKDKGIFFLSDSFNAVTAKNVVTWILESNLDPKRDYDHLTLIINSPGGQVASGFAIIDAMRGSSLPVHTIGLGMIASCGLMTFLAGAKGHRILTPNTAILSHQWSWGSIGKEHELLASVRQYELTNKRVYDLYKSTTGLDDETIRAKLLPAHDVWLSAEEALALGICDEIKIMGA